MTKETMKAIKPYFLSVLSLNKSRNANPNIPIVKNWIITRIEIISIVDSFIVNVLLKSISYLQDTMFKIKSQIYLIFSSFYIKMVMLFKLLYPLYQKTLKKSRVLKIKKEARNGLHSVLIFKRTLKDGLRHSGSSPLLFAILLGFVNLNFAIPV